MSERMARGQHTVHFRTVLIFLIAIIMSGCGGNDAIDEAQDGAASDEQDGDASEPEPEPEPEPVEVRVVVSSITLAYLPSTIGLELGVWEDRGLDVSNINVTGGGEAAQLAAAGEGDILLSAGGSGVGAIAAGLPAHFVSALTLSYDNFAVVVPADSEITDIAGLQGTTIGITSQGSLTHFIVQELVRAQGWEEDDVDVAPVGDLTSRIAALESGRVDAFIGGTDAGLAVEERGVGRVLVRGDQIVENNVNQAIIATDDFIDNNPDALQRYLDGWYETVAWMNENRDEAVTLIMDELGVSKDIAEALYELELPSFSTDGAIPDENLQGLAESALRTGQVEELPAVDTFFDGRFVPVEMT